jgi:nucleoside-diphosphate-sugar epimerase
MTKNISIYGSTGFIGSFYSNLYPNEIIKIKRDQKTPESKDILYLISTINNYNIFDAPHLDINTNLNVLIDTLEACRQEYNSDFVFNFISSWFVYGKTELPAKENSVCNPNGFYSITKRAAEQMLISYCQTYKINYRILRLCNVYGTGDKKASKKRNAFQYLAQEIIKGNTVQLYDNGENIRDFMHIKDVCEAINLIIKNGSVNEIFNIGSGEPNTFIKTMSYVKEKSNSTSQFKFIDPPEFHKIVQVQDMYLDVTKLKQLGFKQKITIWDGLNEIIKNERQ